ncbi:MAG: alkaline phosphatase family protein [Desulfurococcaceae archaeon]
MKHKLLYLVIDGISDSLNDPVTTLELANKPGLDTIARNGICGAMYSVEKGVAPESDEAVISILGYNPHEVYPGRGFIEAIGTGLNIDEEHEVAFRANFATIDPSTMRIIDRRVGRNLSSEEARRLAEAIDGLELGIYGGYARVKATIGHRAVVVIGSREYRLSPMVSNNDPAYVRRGLMSVAVEKYEPFLPKVTPLENTFESRITAELTNVFIDKIIGILDKHIVNEERRSKGYLPANVLLLRDAGNKSPRVISINEKYGCKTIVLAEMPVEIGIGRILGAETKELEPPTGDPRKDYEIRLEESIKALKNNNLVYVHLKGPDEPAHDGNFDLKKKIIENIDKYFVQPLVESKGGEIAILVTSDHSTPPSRRAHSDDPVPIALWIPGVEPDNVTKFTERECIKGSLGIYEHGWLMLPDIITKFLK